MTEEGEREHSSESEGEHEEEVRGCAVLVQNLTANVHRSQLAEIFGTYGRVRSTSVRPVYAGAWREGIVEYARPEHATQARLFMDGGQIDGLTVHVSRFPVFSQLFLLFVLVLLFIVAVVSQLFYVISFSVIVLFISIFSVEVEVEVSMRQQFTDTVSHT